MHKRMPTIKVRRIQSLSAQSEFIENITIAIPIKKVRPPNI